MKRAMCVGLVSLSLCANALSDNDAKTDRLSSTAKLVVLAPHLVEILFELGLGDNIVASSRFANTPEQAKAIERVGDAFTLNIERILELQPDAIVIWKTGTPAAQQQQLARYGLPLVFSHVDEPSDLPREIRRLGAIFSVPEKANQVALNYQQTLESVKSVFADYPSRDFFYLMSKDPLMTATQQAWPNRLLTLCNLKNSIVDTPTDYPLVNLEMLLSLHPEVIVAPVSDLKQVVNVPKVLEELPLVKVEANAFHQMTVSGINSLMQSCQRIQQGIRQIGNGSVD